MSADAASLKDIEKQASEGDSDAMFQVGFAYASGDGVEKNLPKAKKYLNDAANAGNVQAMEYLADIFKEETSEGSRAYVEHWYRKAILGGSETALIKLADYYYLGDGNSNKNAAILYLESVKRKDGDCEREITLLSRMLESGWLDSEWKFFGELVEVLADNGNRNAKHMIRRDEVPEPTDDFDYDALIAEEFPVEDLTYEEKARPRRTWGRTIGKRALTSVLYDMGIEFTKSSNGIIKTKKGEEIRPEIEKLIERGYKFKYSNRTDKWTIVDKTGKE